MTTLVFFIVALVAAVTYTIYAIVDYRLALRDLKESMQELADDGDCEVWMENKLFSIKVFMRDSEGKVTEVA